MRRERGEHCCCCCGVNGEGQRVDGGQGKNPRVHGQQRSPRPIAIRVTYRYPASPVSARFLAPATPRDHGSLPRGHPHRCSAVCWTLANPDLGQSEAWHRRRGMSWNGQKKGKRRRRWSSTWALDEDNAGKWWVSKTNGKEKKEQKIGVKLCRRGRHRYFTLLALPFYFVVFLFACCIHPAPARGPAVLIRAPVMAAVTLPLKLSNSLPVPLPVVLCEHVTRQWRPLGGPSA
jgi:hypothetical protein